MHVEAMNRSGMSAIYKCPRRRSSYCPHLAVWISLADFRGAANALLADLSHLERRADPVEFSISARHMSASQSCWKEI
jgi:hypothetical protein